MDTKYNYRQIEEHWQKEWEQSGLYRVEEQKDKTKFYCLEMFPYPSGNLHIGHMRNYAIGDVVARFKTMEGYNVLHPMGWDAFGLPAENAAIKHGVAPNRWTWDNIANMRRQLKSMGLSYDWEREVATCHPDYYRWTQWLFLQLYHKGLAYKKKAPVNWCPSCATVLANEQVVDNGCERCGTPVEKKDLEQWFFKITDYADRLLADLDKLPGWPDKVKTMQENWIGKSTGARARFTAEKTGDEIFVFTTRPDTIWGVTYLVLAPEHPLVEKLIAGEPGEAEIKEFIHRVRQMSAVDRSSGEREKNGVFSGTYALNPVSGEKVPIWIADYVLAEYGTGAVMGVPAHDQRDLEFARKYNLEVKVVIEPPEGLNEAELAEAYTGPGVMVNSGAMNGLDNGRGKEAVAQLLQEKGAGGPETQYKLRDWLISRQRYWGAPIPIIYCPECGVVPVPEEQLPVMLPDGVEFRPTGESPLTYCEEFLHTTCPHCGAPARRETDTMDTFVCSSWYFLRFTSPQENQAPFSRAKADYWMNVDQYIGGVEHAILHLMYARFFTKVLCDLDLIGVDEPFQNLLTQGMVLYQGGKMSKSKGNVVSPEEIMETYGADTARLFVLFAAPPERDLEWSNQGVEGCFRFLNRVWRLVQRLSRRLADIDGVSEHKTPAGAERELWQVTHHTLKAVTEDLRVKFQFNTAVSRIMELVNALYRYTEEVPEAEQDVSVLKESVTLLLLMLAPFAPHITEELWRRIGFNESVHRQKWPSCDEAALIQEEVTVVVQVNGKLRDRLVAPAGMAALELQEKVLELDKVREFVQGKEISKVVVVPDKLVNLVVR